MSEYDKHVTIIGAGLVGALNACYFAQQNYNVDVFEMRTDPREGPAQVGRSINLAMSYRGLSALQKVGLDQQALEISTPVYGRMIHKQNNIQKPIPYGKSDQCLYAIERSRLNILLLQAASQYQNVKFHFNHRLKSCNFPDGQLIFEINGNSHSRVNWTASRIVGNDGAFSIVRGEILRRSSTNYSQQFINHGYIEIRFPPSRENSYTMNPNYLHIWPRDNFMLMALANGDKSFTGTLFMPHALFRRLASSAQMLEFFIENFPDAVDLIGQATLIESLRSVQANNLVSIKCEPFDYLGKVILLGDAAHAMVPFFGQGMNCGMEDVLILHEILERNEHQFDVSIAEFSRVRCLDAHTINDLAMRNYVDMRHNVNSKVFMFRYYLDKVLHAVLGSQWIPLYTMVSFTRIPYSTCLANRLRQDRILGHLKWTAGSAVLLLLIAKLAADWTAPWM